MSVYDQEVPGANWIQANEDELDYSEEEYTVPTAETEATDLVSLFEIEFEKFIVRSLKSERENSYRIIVTSGYGTETTYDEIDRILWATKHVFKNKYYELKESTFHTTTRRRRELDRILTLLRIMRAHQDLIFQHYMTPDEFQANWHVVKNRMDVKGYHEFRIVSATFLRYLLWPKIRAMTATKFLTGLGCLTNIDYIVSQIDPSVMASVDIDENGIQRAAPFPASDASFWTEMCQKFTL